MKPRKPKVVKPKVVKPKGNAASTQRGKRQTTVQAVNYVETPGDSSSDEDTETLLQRQQRWEVDNAARVAKARKVNTSPPDAPSVAAAECVATQDEDADDMPPPDAPQDAPQETANRMWDTLLAAVPHAICVRCQHKDVNHTGNFVDKGSRGYCCLNTAECEARLTVPASQRTKNRAAAPDAEMRVITETRALLRHHPLVSSKTNGAEVHKDDHVTVLDRRECGESGVQFLLIQTTGRKRDISGRLIVWPFRLSSGREVDPDIEHRTCSICEILWSVH